LPDLRHAGNTLAAATGASPRAALIYQHAPSERDQQIASALSDLARRSVESDDDVVEPMEDSGEAIS
jgi:hypothetical protein